jgi:hypothetical protein
MTLQERSPLTPCPTVQALAAFNDGSLTGDSWKDVAMHLTLCRKCTELIEQVANPDDRVIGQLRMLSKQSPPPSQS